MVATLKLILIFTKIHNLMIFIRVYEIFLDILFFLFYFYSNLVYMPSILETKILFTLQFLVFLYLLIYYIPKELIYIHLLFFILLKVC